MLDLLTILYLQYFLAKLVDGYGESPTKPRYFLKHISSCPSPKLSIQTPSTCTLLPGSPINLIVELEMPFSTSNIICVDIALRHSNQHAWWYMVPPPPFSDEHHQLCGSISNTSIFLSKTVHNMHEKGHIQITASINPATLPANYCLSNKAATVVVEIGTQLTPRRDIDDAHDLVVAFEAHENRIKLLKFKEMAQFFTPPKALIINTSLSPLESIAHLLDPKILNALRNETVYSLSHFLQFKLLPTQNAYNIHAPPPIVPSFLVLVPHAAKLISEFISECKQKSNSHNLTIPNNFKDNQLRTKYMGVVLDEIGLGPLAEAFLKGVLVPLSRVLHPNWSTSFIDSYHAFSLHVGGGIGHRRASPVEHAVVGDRLPSHIDICEVSMNLCLGNIFSGSEMLFQKVSGSDNVVQQHLEHRPGYAFLNLCQHFHGTDALTSGERNAIVVRGLSSQFRSSPAEMWSTTCPRFLNKKKISVFSEL